MLIKIILTCVILIAYNCDAAKILITYPTISKSHILPLQSLAFTLVKKGHDVTFMTSYPTGKKIDNYREIKVPFDESEKDSLIALTTDPEKGGMLTMFPKMLNMIYTLGNKTLQSDETKLLMKTGKFDVVIAGYFMTDFMLGLGDHFKCPTIMFSPAGAMGTMYEAIGNPKGVNGFPHVIIAEKTMDFKGRLKTFLMTLVENLMVSYMKYRSRQVYDFNFPAEHYRSYDDSLKNVSLVLLNNHFSSTGPRPLLPNMVEVGGLQVDAKPAPLPDDMKKFLDEAKDGAILFSLGSNAKSTHLPVATVKTLLNVFGRRKQRVVMKWESDSLEGKPENVFISKWLPQNDVLAHPNIKIFISHCGMGGVVEAKFHGVPIIGLPMFAEQKGNLGSIVKEGWAIELSIETIDEKNLEAAIVEILKNQKYSQMVKQQSKLVSDRPLSAQETAAYWVEYVIRHHGAPHMHYPGADQNFIQQNSLDVIGFLIFTIYAAIKILKLLFKTICRMCCGSKGARKQKIN